MKLCVLLWAVPGQEQQLIEYEDLVLPRLAAYDARVVQRVRSQEAADGPLEVHILDFPSEDALEQYLADPERASWSALRDRSIARSEVLRVEDVGRTP
jgi:uncharacterized protein (DUF1330 family)